MVSRCLAYVVAVCASVAVPLAVAHADPRAVIELFTSQGCSSCPPADKLIGEFAADPSLVSISLPIDYWDYLGWKDTLADPHHTARQKGYSKVRGDREVYTPQALTVGDGRLMVAVPDGNDLHALAEVWICALTKAVTVSIKRGENRGKTITYFNVARRWLKLDNWNGKAHSWTVPLRDFASDGIDRAAVMVQSGTVEKPNVMLGAALVAIR